MSAWTCENCGFEGESINGPNPGERVRCIECAPAMRAALGLDPVARLTPDTSWVIAFKEPPARSGDMHRMNDAIISWCKKEGVRLPLILWGATAAIIEKEEGP